MPQLNTIRRLEEKRKRKQGIYAVANDGVAIFRVSSHGQAKEGWSLEAQKRYLYKHALENNINIVAEFTEEETAKKSGRKIFNEMIKFLKKHKNVKNILVEKTDRLYRNFKDYIIIDDLGVKVHLVKENSVICPDSRSHDKFIHGIKVLMAKNYIDNLREEIVKGLAEKAEQGHYPSTAPLGYVNFRDSSGKSYIIPDKEKAIFIRRIFSLYSNDDISFKLLAKQMAFEGFTTRRGAKPTARTIEVVLQNIVYTCNFYWNGILYQGKHKPLIEQRLFDKVDSLFNKPERTKNKKRKNSLTYKGIFRCGVCGSLMTGEKHKGAHNSGEYEYYKCANPKCKKHYISGKAINDKIINLFERIQIKPEYVEPLKKGLLELHQVRKEEQNENVINIQKQLKETKNKLVILTEKLLDSVIDNEVYKIKHAEFMNKKIQLEAREKELNKNSDKFNEHVENIIELGKFLPTLYKEACTDKKRKLLKLVISNPTIKGKELILEPIPFFEQVGNLALLKNGGEGGI